MTITRFGFSQRHDIAFITDDFKFYYFTLRFAQHMHHISYVHHDKIREVFKRFNIIDKTDILVQDTVDSFCPLYLYFRIILPYVKFSITTVSLAKIIKRIYYKHKRFSKQVANKTAEVTVKNVNMFLYRAWNFLVETEECPWITKNIDNQLKLYSEDEAKHQQRARVCLYYMFVKKQYMMLNKKCNNKKCNNSLIQ